MARLDKPTPAQKPPAPVAQSAQGPKPAPQPIFTDYASL